MSQLIVKSVSKRFGTVDALCDVSAQFSSGEIHAVLGENGAGKSTLMNVMSGFIAPDSGAVLLDGVPIPLGRAFECKRLGIEMIHQHFTLVPEFSAVENLALGKLNKLAARVDLAELAQPAFDSAASLGWIVDPQSRTGDLSVGGQQRIEILKATGSQARVLIFDEPTAVLTPDEVEDLFRILKSFRDEGRIVILIAHKLSEVLAIADRVTVLRRGALVAEAPRSEVDADRLATWMVGELPPKPVRTQATVTGEGIEARDLTVFGDRKEMSVGAVSFSIKRGEVLGFGGVDGNGQVELAECLAQVRSPKSGTIKWRDKPLQSSDLRTGYVPQDRQLDGLASTMTIQDNLLLGATSDKTLTRGPFLRLRAIREWAQALIARFSIKVGCQRDPAGSLSGGNQQKLIVSRTLSQEPDFLIVVNPGRGLDVMAGSYVYARILEARDRGACVALFSTDLEELYALSDRTVFMSRGRLVADTGAAALLGGVD